MTVWGVRGEQVLGDTAYSGTLLANVDWERGIDGFQYVSASSLGASTSISLISSGTYIPYLNPPQIMQGTGEFTQEVIDTVQAWVNSITDGTMQFIWYWRVYEVKSSAGTMMDLVTDRVLYCNGWYTKQPATLPATFGFKGITYIQEDFSIGSSGIYRRCLVTNEYVPEDTELRHPTQRKGEDRWYADENTEVYASIGTTSVTKNYGAGTETDVTSALVFSLSQSLTSAKDINTTYCGVKSTFVQDGVEHTLDFSKLTFQIDNHTVGSNGHNGAVMHYHGDETYPDPLTYDTAATSSSIISWKMIQDSNGYWALQRGTLGSGAKAFSQTITNVNHIKFDLKLYKALNGLNTHVDYGDYDDSKGQPFDVGLFKRDDQTDADVSLAPGIHEYDEFWIYTTPVPYAISRSFASLGSGIQVKLRWDWCEVNDEDVVFTHQDRKDYPRDEIDDYGNPIHYDGKDLILPIAFHGLKADMKDYPGVKDWITVVRTELNLDKPDGEHRPSSWTATNGAEIDCNTMVLTVPAAGGILGRILANNRRYNRMWRLVSYAYPLPLKEDSSAGEYSADWLLMTKANLPITTTLDDPKWWDPAAVPHSGELPGIEYEDVSDWSSFSCVNLQTTGATQDIAVTLVIKYREITGSCIRYTSAEEKWGPDSSWEITIGEQQEYEVPSTLKYETGQLKFDLCSNSGVTMPDLWMVDEIGFYFGSSSSEQHITITSWATVPYAAESIIEYWDRIAMKWSNDFFGARTYLDGMPNYRPHYFYTVDTERVEVGFKHTNELFHDPDSQATGELHSMKTLDAWVGEWLLAEHILRPTWNQNTVDAELKDINDTSLIQPLWGDYVEGTDWTGWYHLKVGLAISYGYTYCECILQGNERGVCKLDGIREIDQASPWIKLYESQDNGITKTKIGESGTDGVGAYLLYAGKEKTPRTYYLKGSGSYQSLGSFVNLEIGWVTASSGGAPGYPFIARDELGNPISMTTEAAGVIYYWYWNGDSPVAMTAHPYSSDGIHHWSSVCVDARGITKICATNTNTGTMDITISKDAGHTWEAPVSNLGSDLEYGTITSWRGHTYVCGWHDNKIYVATSTQGSLARDAWYGSTYIIEVCAAVVGENDEKPRSSIAIHSDGSVHVAVGTATGYKVYRMRKYEDGFVEI